MQCLGGHGYIMFSGYLLLGVAWAASARSVQATGTGNEGRGVLSVEDTDSRVLLCQDPASNDFVAANDAHRSRAANEARRGTLHVLTPDYSCAAGRTPDVACASGGNSSTRMTFATTLRYSLSVAPSNSLIAPASIVAVIAASPPAPTSGRRANLSDAEVVGPKGWRQSFCLLCRRASSSSTRAARSFGRSVAFFCRISSSRSRTRNRPIVIATSEDTCTRSSYRSLSPINPSTSNGPARVRSNRCPPARISSLVGLIVDVCSR